MEKQSTLAYYAKKGVQPSLGLFGILREALKTGIRNGRLLLFIATIMFSYYTVKELTDTFIVLPWAKDHLVNYSQLAFPKNGSFVDADPVIQQAVFKRARFSFIHLFVILSFFCLVLSFAVAASVHSTSEAYTAKVLSLKDMLLGTKGRWKRALKTSFWMVIISLASVALLLFGIGVVGVMTGTTVPGALNLTLLILGGYAIYLCSLWTLSLVVSVMEENQSGLKAIIRASELMKGKNLQGFVLMLIMSFASWVIPEAFYWFASILTTTQGAKLSTVVNLAIIIPSNFAYCVLQLFAFVVYTLFYHECKNAEENAALYAPIPAVAEV